MPRKNVLLAIIDGMSWRTVAPALKQGRLPFLAELARRGAAQPCTSIFPSITPAATASLVTGKAPREHAIQGAFWYDRSRDDVAYFGDSLRVILREGFSDFVDDYLRKLNEDLLTTPTLFELADDRGASSACLNLMWRQGRDRHSVDAPLLTKLLPGVTISGDISGPKWLFLGEFVDTELPGAARVKFPGGPLRRFGFNDEATLAQLGRLLKSDVDPRLTVAYFPDNDFDSHDVGPEAAEETLRKLDDGLTRLARDRGGVEAWLAETAFVVVGDHGHDELVTDARERSIRLDELYEDLRQTPAGSDPGEGDQVVLCPNMRAAQITPLGGVDADSLVRRALDDARVDQAIRRDGLGGFEVRRPGGGLRFRESDHGLADARGRRWEIEGDLSVVDAEQDGQDRLVYGEYPDALGRIADGAPACQDSLWITARPGYEFKTAGTTVHERGSHGSLHRGDSRSVLITAGLPAGVAAPDEASIVDVASLCLAALDAVAAAEADTTLATH